MSFLRSLRDKLFGPELSPEERRAQLDARYLAIAQAVIPELEYKQMDLPPTQEEIRVCAYYAAEKDGFSKSPEYYWTWAEQYLLWHDSVMDAAHSCD